MTYAIDALAAAKLALHLEELFGDARATELLYYPEVARALRRVHELTICCASSRLMTLPSSGGKALPESLALGDKRLVVCVITQLSTLASPLLELLSLHRRQATQQRTLLGRVAFVSSQRVRAPSDHHT